MRVEGAHYALAHLAAYLDIKPAPMDDRTPVLLVNAGGRHVALMVDNIEHALETLSSKNFTMITEDDLQELE